MNRSNIADAGMQADRIIEDFYIIKYGRAGGHAAGQLAVEHFSQGVTLQPLRSLIYPATLSSSPDWESGVTERGENFSFIHFSGILYDEQWRLYISVPAPKKGVRCSQTPFDRPLGAANERDRRPSYLLMPDTTDDSECRGGV